MYRLAVSFSAFGFVAGIGGYTILSALLLMLAGLLALKRLELIQ